LGSYGWPSNQKVVGSSTTVVAGVSVREPPAMAVFMAAA